MSTTPTTPAARHEAACRRERDAWIRLAQRERRRSPRSTEDVDSWLEATREFRETQALVTAAAVNSATQALRESAALLTGACAAPEPSSLAGQRFVDHNDVTWEVRDVVVDVFEPEFFLIQIAPVGDGHADPVDVYSDDWGVFCLVHGLRAA